MARSDRQLLDALSRTPFIEPVKLALILGEPHATVRRHLSGLLADVRKRLGKLYEAIETIELTLEGPLTPDHVPEAP